MTAPVQTNQPQPEPHAASRIAKRRGWPEIWVLALMLLLAAVVAGHWYVFHGGDREVALWMYKRGRFMAVMAACALVGIGLLHAWRRPPLVRAWRLEGILLALVVIFSAPIPYAYPSSRKNSPSQVELAMPVTGEWRVLAGNRTGAHNPLSLEPDRCFGMLLAREEGGRRWKPEAIDRVDSMLSYTYGSAVTSPVDGEVVAAVDSEADRSFQLRVEDATERGNHVVLRLETGEYLILAHLLKGSLRVKVGDRVQRGQPLAEVGSSGRGVPLTEPHLAIHMSTKVETGEGEGIPFRMSGYESLEESGVVGTEAPDGRPQGGLGDRGGPPGALIRPKL